MGNKRVLGVDFGSSKTSCIYGVDNGQKCMFPIMKGESYRWDTAVYEGSNGTKYFSLAYGEAKNAKGDDNLKISLKEDIVDREIGCKKRVKDFFEELLKKGTVHGEKTLSTELGVKDTSEVVRSLDEIVCGHPAYFHPNHLEDYRACMKEVFGAKVKLIEEPVLAACYYHDQNYQKNNDYKPEIEDKILVLDMGGYTMDVALLQIVEYVGKKTIKPIRCGSYESTQVQMGKALTFNLAMQIYGEERYDSAIENAKCRLLRREQPKEASVELQYGGNQATIYFDGVKLATLGGLRQLKKNIEACIDGWLRHYDVEKDEIKYVILTGGSSKIKVIQQHIEDFFKKNKVLYIDDTDIAVAQGACLVAWGAFPYVTDSKERERRERKEHINNADTVAIFQQVFGTMSDEARAEFIEKINSATIKQKI